MMIMKKCQSQQGNIMVITIMVFLAVGVIAMGLITAAGMEVQMAAYDLYAEQVRQAADAGIYVARDVIINYIQDGRDIPEFNNITLPNGTSAEITVEDAGGSVNPAGITKVIISRGMLTGNSGKVLARKTVEAKVYIDPALLEAPQDNEKIGKIIYYKYSY